VAMVMRDGPPRSRRICLRNQALGGGSWRVTQRRARHDLACMRPDPAQLALQGGA
jgi:hypothetical protein